MSSIPHDHVAGHGEGARRPRAPSHGDHALDHDDQPQGHRHAVPVVLVHDVHRRRLHGAHDPRRAVPAGAAGRQSRVLQLADHAARPDHGVRRDHARRGRLRQLADPADDRRARHGVRADEQLELLAAAARGDPAGRLVVRPGRRRRGRLDALSAAHDAGRHGHGLHDLRRPHHGRVVDHGLDQHHHDHPQPARARHDADEDAAVLLDVAHHRVPADRGDAGAGGRGDDAADRPPLRHHLLQRRRRRRPGAVPARVLVLRPPRGLHHHPAGVRRHLGDHPDVLAQAAVRLRLDGLRGGRRSRSCRSSSGRTTCSRSACRRPACCSSCTRRC